MSKVAHYLQEHLVGEVLSSTDARNYFATDGSILQVAPLIVVYPKNENDIRKTARFSWQLAERGRIVPITARGAGTSQSGAAIGNGMVLIFPAHLNRILELNAKANIAVIEPGINFAKLQQALQTHGKYIPAFPTSMDYTTLGGAIANNIPSVRSLSFGPILNAIKSLRVVLANGEVIETRRLNKRELSKKLGLSTFEGEIYRSIDTMIEEQHAIVEKMARDTVNNNAGYNLSDIKHKDGSFDLTPLMAGSQGTLGLISEAVLATENYDPKTNLIVAHFDSLEHLQQAVIELNELPDRPNTIELIDKYALDQINEINPNRLGESLKPPHRPFILFIEYNGEHPPKTSAKKVTRLLDKYARQFDSYTELEDQLQYWKIREAVSVLIAHNEGLIHSVPLFDGSVPLDRIREFLDGIYKLTSGSSLVPALWGNVGLGSLQLRPKLNLGHVGDRQKAFRLMDEYNKLVISLNGTISSSDGDGRLRTPYLEEMYGNDVYSLMYKTKQIFDPYGTLNPGVKFNTTIDDLKEIIRPDYNLRQLYDHLPRS